MSEVGKRPIPENHPIRFVAIQINGVVFRLPPPYRHHDIIKKLSDLGLPWPIRGTQGFVDVNGDFLTRQVAAKACGLEPLAELYSEDLW